MAESDTSTPTEAGDEGFDNLPLDDENTTDEDWRMIKKDKIVILWLILLTIEKQTDISVLNVEKLFKVLTMVEAQ